MLTIDLQKVGFELHKSADLHTVVSKGLLQNSAKPALRWLKNMSLPIKKLVKLASTWYGSK